MGRRERKLGLQGNRSLDKYDKSVVLDTEVTPMQLSTEQVSINKLQVNGDMQVKGKMSGVHLKDPLDGGGQTLGNIASVSADDVITPSINGCDTAHKAPYAGQIIGYRMIGEDASHASYTLTTSYAVPDSNMKCRFVVPPSGAVEVMIQIHANASTSNRYVYFGLSDNATYNTIGVSYEQQARFPDETDDSVVQHFWVVTGLTEGATTEWWLGARTNAINSYLNWGGNSTGRYCDFIMKITALPPASTHEVEYD